MSGIIIAIDGFSACGKSTLARDLARRLGYAYIDTGAMYRAVTLYFLDRGIDPDNSEGVKEALENLTIRFVVDQNGNGATYLNGKNVEQAIRSMAVSEKVSEVAALSAVRKAMVRQQQEMGGEKCVVLDGRDIGTVVFPNAELKIFLTADFNERLRRRYEELQGGNTGAVPQKGEVEQNLRKRDHIDSTRADSPLRQAEDARLLDNTTLNRQEQLDLALCWAKEIIGRLPACSDLQDDTTP